VKKTQGKAAINSVNKPIEHNPPGKDTSNRIARAIGKAADMASSNKGRKVWRINMAVAFRICFVFLKSLHEASWMPLHILCLVPLLHFLKFCPNRLQCSLTVKSNT
jgi:hypothetical protein